MSLPSQKHVFITCKKNVCRNERSYKIFVYKYLGKFSFEKKKSVNFHTFGPDPSPPLKSVKLNKIFFLTH